MPPAAFPEDAGCQLNREGAGWDVPIGTRGVSGGHVGSSDNMPLTKSSHSRSNVKINRPLRADHSGFASG